MMEDRQRYHNVLLTANQDGNKRHYVVSRPIS